MLIENILRFLSYKSNFILVSTFIIITKFFVYTCMCVTLQMNVKKLNKNEVEYFTENIDLSC